MRPAADLTLICWVSFGPVELVLKLLMVFCPFPQLDQVSEQNSSIRSWFSSLLPSSRSLLSSVVKVFVQVTGPTCGADQAILKKLQPRSWTLKITDNWAESDLFLVFCPVTTRPGADVEAAMRKLQGENFPPADLLAT